MTCFIISGIEIEKNSRKAEEESIGIKVEIAKGEKCERCWKYRVLDKNSEHPTICEDCQKAICE